MYCSSLLIFLEFITLSHGYMFWNPDQIEYERLKEAANEAIAQEEKKKYDPQLDLAKEMRQSDSQGEFSNLRSMFPIWSPWSSPTLQMPSDIPTTILSTDKSKSSIFRRSWSSKLAFPTKQRSIKKAKTFKHNKSRKLKNGGLKKSNNKKYNPLCFFSALPCGPRRKNVYYVPRKNQK